MDCSVLVPVYNEKSHIAASVAAMRRQRFGGRLEFLLVDGGSTDGTQEILRRLAREDPRIRLLGNPRRAIPAGLNVALANARGQWVARMDAHSQYPEDYLERGVSRLMRGDVRWVSGPQLPVGRSAVGRAAALALSSPLGRGGSGRWATSASASDPEYELDTGVFCGVWARETLLEYGGWDERWERNEDSEMAARFIANGERLVCLPAMAAVYRPRETLTAVWRQYLDNGEFRAKTARWYPQTLRRSSVLPSGVALACVGAVASPRAVRQWLRAGLSIYGAVLAAAGLKAVTETDRLRDAAAVPAVLAVMHTAFGAGVLRGSWRHGAPLAALASNAGLDGLAARLSDPLGDVFAPSLEECSLPRIASEPLREAA